MSNSNTNNNRNEMNRQFSRHVPDEWDFEVPNGENKSQIKENFKNVKIKKAFIVGNSYGGSNHFDNDATKISEILQEKCQYNCTLVLNESNLKKKFQEYLNSFKFTEINIDFIFYYSGHVVSKKNGLEFELDNNTKLKSKKLFLSLNEIIEMVEIREKEIQAGCEKLLDLKLVFKKLFILECCRLNDDSPIDPYIPIFKKYQKDVETQFKDCKNLSFLYSTNLGENNQTNHWSECISTFTDSLVGRISSPRAPGRNLKTMGQIISEDLLNRYKNSNMGDFSKQYKMWFSGLNMFSLSENNNNSIFNGNGGAVAENVIPELFEKFVKEKFNVLFGDKGMNKFILVENEDPLEVMKKQKQLYLKNRQKQLLPSSPSTPTLSNSSSSVPVLITSPIIGKNILSGSGGIDFGSPNWSRANFMSQSSPNVPLSITNNNNNNNNYNNSGSGGNSPKLFIGSNKFRSESPTPSYSPIQSEGYEDSTIECDMGQSSSSSTTNSKALSPSLISNKPESIQSNSTNSSTYEFATNNNMFLKKGDWRVTNQQLL